jgi:hypothetical protein
MIPLTPLKKPGVFKVGGKKENKSDLFFAKIKEGSLLFDLTTSLCLCIFVVKLDLTLVNIATRTAIKHFPAK